MLCWPLQPDAPSWRRCLCWCNPCWCSDGEESNDGDDDVNDGFIGRETELVGLSTISCDEEQQPITRGNDETLPPNYDPPQVYENKFGEFDAMTGEKRSLSRHGPVVKLKGGEATLRGVCERLDAGHPLEALLLIPDLNLLLIMVRQSPPDSTERHDLIDLYERYCNKFSQHASLQHSTLIAAVALSSARHPDSSHQERLENYRKALFFTHPSDTKLLLKQEYCQYCDSLMR